jgi:hypothetical protein
MVLPRGAKAVTEKIPQWMKIPSLASVNQAGGVVMAVRLGGGPRGNQQTRSSATATPGRALRG